MHFRVRNSEWRPAINIDFAGTSLHNNGPYPKGVQTSIHDLSLFQAGVRQTPGEHECGMRKVLTRILCLAVVTQFIFACTGLQPTRPVLDQASSQSHRTASAQHALLELNEIDTLIKLDNRWLGEQIDRGLRAQAAISDSFSFRKLNVRFNKQLIALEAVLDIVDNSGNFISASASGNVLLDFSGNHLEWFPRFNKLQISSAGFSFEQETYVATDPELNQLLLQRLNTGIADSLILHDNNAIPLNAVPLGEIEVGASLPGFAHSVARKKQLLTGVFIMVGSAMLVEPSVTSIALDLEFIADFSICPADVTVSRAVFTSGIKEREPVDLARNMTDSEDVSYFYSEISGAIRPLTIVHYWFADGQPVAIEELPVEPSEHWRTWSSKGSSRTGASHWEVLVVEKESGCILHSQAIRTLDAEDVISQTDQARANRDFAALRDAFNARTAGFSITKDRPDIALIEVRRAFLRDVLQASLVDLRVEASFDQAALPQLVFTALIRPFETADITCEQGNCTPAPACVESLLQCKRRGDTRDCSTCLFRNPLNNRCVSQAVDPICEAARSRQNAKYDADRKSCVASAEAAKLDCERLSAQALRSCEIESGFEQSVCEAIKSGIASMHEGNPLATAEAQVTFQGQLGVLFSNISIDGDFTRLKVDMELKSNMIVDGKLEFRPGNIPQPLASCVIAWSVPFSGRAVGSVAVNRMLTTLSEDANVFTSNWSGFELSVETTPSPLESIFVGHPHLLANCSIGLTVNDVEQAFMGEGAEFFKGRVKLEIQPMPIIIRLSPATLEYDDRVFRGNAMITSNHVRYDVGR